jgi:ribosomal protein S18 acetylase RimI-like enzyme
MTDIEIRPAAPADAPAIAAVHVDSFLATYPHLPFTRRSAAAGLEGRTAVWDSVLRSPRPGHSVLVATEDGDVDGFVHLGPSPDNDTGHVFSIHVSPKLAGQGVGRRLLGEAVALLGQAGFGRMSLWVVADNKGARRFYERLGWREEPVRRNERLAVGDEEGDEVEVVRYRLDLGDGA